MNKSQRIRTTIGSDTDKHLKIKLEQDTKTVEILSLKIDQKDIYQSFNSDYGVLVGRVIANGGIGIPNAKISIFIPISDEDMNNEDIMAIYPYSSPRDKNANGVRYNLLPRVAVNNPFNTIGQYSPVVPVGSFPTKEEILTNDTFLEVYEKYYKFTTVSNQAGDYMIFGVPVGVHDVHMSVDITDIGSFSMTPATMISQLGYSPQLFENNKIKFSTDLDTLPNIETQNISVDIRPFWGDTENFEIGITRQDFKIRATLVSSVTVFGAGFTDDEYAVWGMIDYFGERDDSVSTMSINESGNFTSNNDGTKYNTGIASRRNGRFDIEVYTIPSRISNDDIALGNFNTMTDIQLMEKTQYSEILEDGMFILTLPCNRGRKITNEFGELVPTTEDDPNGIFTEFAGMFIVEYGPELDIIRKKNSRTERNRSDRGRLKIPQHAKAPNENNASFSESFTSERAGTIAGHTLEERRELNEKWRKQAHIFEGGKLYTVSKFYGASYENRSGGNWQIQFSTTGDTGTGSYLNTNVWRNAGGLPQISENDENTGMVYNTNSAVMQISGDRHVSNETINNLKTFVGEWLNMSIYFPQIYNYTDGAIDVTRMMTSDYGDGTDMTVINQYRVVGNRIDTSYFLRSDLHQTKFVEVPTEDLVNIIQNVPNRKGFKSNDSEFQSNQLIGNYPSQTGIKYFYKGLHNADIIDFLIRNGVISA